MTRDKLKHLEDVLREMESVIVLGYTYVTLDLAGFRSGSMNEGLVAGEAEDGY